MQSTGQPASPEETRRIRGQLRPVVDLLKPSSWHAVIERVISRHIAPEVTEALQRVPAAGMFEDTMEYLDDALMSAGQESVNEILPRLQAAVSRGFSAIRAFHACKPVSLASYYEHGIVPLTRDWLAQEAFALFEGTIPQEEINQAVARADLSIREGLVWFATDPNELTGLAGHYLIYGPESINCLWQDHERRFRESQERQRRRGIPTLFECAVPLSLIDSQWKREFTKRLLTEYFKGHSLIPDPDSSSAEFGFCVRHDVGPEHIIGHAHPVFISDPLRHGTQYHNPVSRCPWCD